MTDLWGSFDPRDVAKRIQERASPPAKVANVANHGGGIAEISRFSQLSQPIPALRVPAVESWSAKDWSYLFHERAGFLEHDCHQSRQEAEQRALHEMEALWIARHPMPAGAPESGCVHCGKAGGDLLPRLACGRSAHFWLHQACWRDFEKARRAEARAALQKLIPDLPVRDALDELLDDESSVGASDDR